MTTSGDLASSASGADPRVGLKAASALRRLAETLESAQVTNARDQGWSWQDIADVLGVTKQAVHQKYSAAQKKAGRHDV
jgi:DNA-directed RNA polymerase specialized sigma24 family protein